MKNILVISHNSFSKTQNNGKTLESFFSQWDKKNLAQIYLQPEEPDFDFCDNYFRMTDYEAINNVLFKGEIGHKVTNKINNNEFIENTNPYIKKLYADRRINNERVGLSKIIHGGFIKRIPSLIFLRDLVWDLANWKSKKLTQWIEEFNPDIVFFQGSNSVFGYKIALWVTKKYNIPLITQLTDDYTKSIYKLSPIETINKLRYKNLLRKAISLSKKTIVISNYMSDEYREKFKGNYLTLMNSISGISLAPKITQHQNINFIYAGNVLIKRWEILLSIGKALSSINKELNINCKLSINSPTPIPTDILKALSKENTIDCGPSLTHKKLIKKIEESDFLVHVESFDKKMRTITRLSISTKIPEYLSSNRCIFAVGPNDIASIKYLSENSLAYVSKSPKEDHIKEHIKALILNKDLQKELIRNANLFYNKYHTNSYNTNQINKIINED